MFTTAHQPANIAAIVILAQTACHPRPPLAVMLATLQQNLCELLGSGYQRLRNLGSATTATTAHNSGVHRVDLWSSEVLSGPAPTTRGWALLRRNMLSNGKQSGFTWGDIILPTSAFKEQWDTMVMFLIIYVGIVVPVRFCFHAAAQGSLLIFEAGVSLVFIADLVLW